jgi:hypothetical protein
MRPTLSYIPVLIFILHASLAAAAQHSSDDRPIEVARLRAKLGITRSGTKISITLHDGQIWEGKLAEVTEDDFSLAVNLENETRGNLKKHIRFAEVESAEIPLANGWTTPEAIRTLPSGKRIEILLLNETTLEGHLSRVSDQGFVLDLGKERDQEIAWDEVVLVRERGMRGIYKFLIVVGIVYAMGNILAATQGYTYP